MLDWLFKKEPNAERLTELAALIGNEINHRIETKLTDEFSALAEVDQMQDKVTQLQKDIAKLNAEKLNIQEGFDRERREIEHKVGLLRTEIEAGDKQKEKDYVLRLKEAQLAARETGLGEREKAFTEQMKFIQSRFEGEVGYLKNMVADVLKRLPDAAILATKEL